MNTMNQANFQADQFHGVLEKIGEIVGKTEGKYYIYRGESELYPQVCSNLYRAYLSLEVQNPTEAVQKSQELIVEEAKKFLTGNDFYDTFLPIVNPAFAPISKDSEEFEILAQLQHYGCRTNLIDFTTDYLVALYFACAHSPEESGRVICLEIVDKNENGEFFWTDKDDIRHKVLEMSTIIKRAIFQKSRFIQTDNGIIEIEEIDTVTIPASLKKDLKRYLKVYHNISTNNIYGDIHGFIQGLNIYPAGYRELQNGKMYEDAGDSLKNAKERKDLHEEARDYYKEALKKEDRIHFEVYLSLGRVSAKLEDFDTAIQNYNQAIEQDPGNPMVLSSLGDVYSQIGNGFLKDDNGKKDENYQVAIQEEGIQIYQVAIQNYNQAIEQDPGNAEYYSSRGNVYRLIGQSDMAIEDYKRVIKLDPRKFSPYRELHILYLGRREWQKAEEVRADLNKVISTIKDKRERGEFDEVLAELLPMYYCERCKLCLVDHAWEKAEEYLTKLIGVNHINIPLLLKDIKKFDELPKNMEEVINQELEKRKEHPIGLM